MSTNDFPGLAAFQSNKIVRAGEITEVVAAGCYVKTASGDTVLLTYQPNMTARYQPQVGDFWVIYAPDDYASVSPRSQFVAGYTELTAEGAMAEAMAKVHLEFWPYAEPT